MRKGLSFTVNFYQRRRSNYVQENLKHASGCGNAAERDAHSICNGSGNPGRNRR
jgi:hypothetical protein